jgi:hypothetical protein
MDTRWADAVNMLRDPKGEDPRRIHGRRFVNVHARPGEPLRLGPVDYLREPQDVAVELAQGGILCGHRFALGLVCRVCSPAPLRAGRRVGVDFGSRRPDGGVGTLLAGLAGLGTYFLAGPGCSRELTLLAFGKLAERVDLIAFVKTRAGDVVEDGHLLGASYIAGDGAPPFAGPYGDVGHERFQVLILRT